MDTCDTLFKGQLQCSDKLIFIGEFMFEETKFEKDFQKFVLVSQIRSFKVVEVFPDNVRFQSFSEKISGSDCL